MHVIYMEILNVKLERAKTRQRDDDDDDDDDSDDGDDDDEILALLTPTK
jgi:hypothetical protein